MSLKDAFQGMRDAAAEKPTPKLVKPAPTAPLPVQGTGKRSHPEFEPVKIYLRKTTHKAARRALLEGEDGDFSDLVQKLLEEHLRS